mmetsp:Transcript_82739/g.145923  ORF Transcript_82739/g.145923 Transcript_82739/m.145923 type:complete len:333 (+) Transcript_82739:1394-2392(+)
MLVVPGVSVRDGRAVPNAGNLVPIVPPGQDAGVRVCVVPEPPIRLPIIVDDHFLPSCAAAPGDDLWLRQALCKRVAVPAEFGDTTARHERSHYFAAVAQEALQVGVLKGGGQLVAVCLQLRVGLGLGLEASLDELVGGGLPQLEGLAPVRLGDPELEAGVGLVGHPRASGDLDGEPLVLDQVALLLHRQLHVVTANEEYEDKHCQRPAQHPREGEHLGLPELYARPLHWEGNEHGGGRSDGWGREQHQPDHPRGEVCRRDTVDDEEVLGLRRSPQAHEAAHGSDVVRVVQVREVHGGGCVLVLRHGVHERVARLRVLNEKALDTGGELPDEP